jgi:hypothetical protein
MLQSAHGSACVVDAEGRFDGVIQLDTIMTEIAAMQEAARRRAAELRAREESA